MKLLHLTLTATLLLAGSVKAADQKAEAIALTKEFLDTRGNQQTFSHYASRYMALCKGPDGAVKPELQKLHDTLSEHQNGTSVPIMRPVLLEALTPITTSKEFTDEFGTNWVHKFDTGLVNRVQKNRKAFGPPRRTMPGREHKRT